MEKVFVGAAISRQDGGEQDGIHLLWSPPRIAGYSVRGFDIQRRRAQPAAKPDCIRLGEAELGQLHQQLRFSFRYGELSVRQASCPVFPQQPPDTPFPEAEQSTCIILREQPVARYPQPLRLKGAEFRVFGSEGKLLPAVTIGQLSTFVGLHTGVRTEVQLPQPVARVSLQTVHLARAGSAIGFNMQGKAVAKAAIRGGSRQVITTVLKGDKISRITLEFPQNEALLLQLCYGDDVDRPAADEQAGRPSTFPAISSSGWGGAGSPVSSSATTTIHQPGSCIAYTFDFTHHHQYVEIHPQVAAALAIAFRDEKAVDTQVQPTQPGQPLAFHFRQRDVNRVILYTTRPLTALLICVDVPLSPEQEEASWREAPYLIKGLQLPLPALHPEVSDLAAARNLALGRLFGSESLDLAAFAEVVDLLDPAAARAEAYPPTYATTRTRERSEDPHADLGTWSYGLATLLDPSWRRALGFGYLDKGSALTPGQGYDYRITGYFRQRDILETFYGFHTVPEGTTLPAGFRLGTTLLRTPEPARVGLFPAPTGLRATGRKGLSLLPPATPEGWSLRLRFSQAITEIVLEFTDEATSWRYRATTAGYVLGIGAAILSDGFTAGPRVLLRFSDPIEQLDLAGRGTFFGLRLPTPGVTLAEGEKVIPVAQAVYQVVYAPTAAPAAPSFLGTQHLQDPPVVGNALAATERPRQDLGFRLQWLPPHPAGALPWPPDLAAAPPFEGLAFLLERRRVDTGEPFQPLTAPGEADATHFMGSRGGRPDLPPLSYGVDLLTVFPEKVSSPPPVSPLMQADDVLVSAGTSSGEPGARYQYRIFSLDVLGRSSAVATLGSIVRLEKRVPPPVPAAPVLPPDTAEAEDGGGVRARALQATDPQLSATDRSLLGSSQTAIVLEWGWTDIQRAMDPYASEFRVYWRQPPPDRIHGEFTGTASLSGGWWQVGARLDQAIAPDQFRGKYINAGGYPFKIHAHSGGVNISLQLQPSALDSARAPQPGAFVLLAPPAGEALRPAQWTERIVVVPITAAENYQHIVRDRFALTPAQPQFYAWVGVSAADAEAYIPDELPTAVPLGGRPGNESSIAVAPVTARYYGSPVLTLPPPLADVPERVTNEPTGAGVSLQLDLPALFGTTLDLPPGQPVLLERCATAELLGRISLAASGQLSFHFSKTDTQAYALDNPTDQAAFTAQLRAGLPPAIEGRFLLDIVNRFGARLDALFERATPIPQAYGMVDDTLPNKAERYLYRLRMVDAAGHRSAAAAPLPLIVRVPSLRAPGAPALRLRDSADATLRVQATVRKAFDLRWLLLFVDSRPLAEAPGPALTDKAQLLRLPNRRDLYPADGLRLRLADGRLLQPFLSLEVGTGRSEPPNWVLEPTLSLAYDRRVLVWGVAMTRDGIPSPFAGPVSVTTGPAPVAAPLPTVVTTLSGDHLSWTAPADRAEVSIEKAGSSADDWQRVSPWLPATVTSFAVAADSGTRRYRLRARGSRGQTTVGGEVLI